MVFFHEAQCNVNRSDAVGNCMLLALRANLLANRVTLVKNSDPILIDAEKRELTLCVSAAELKKRKQAWKKPSPRYTRGVLAKYAARVTSASEGAVTDADLKL